MSGLKGRFLDELEDSLGIVDVGERNSVCKVVDTASKVAGIYYYNQANVSYERLPTGHFKIADSYTYAEELEVRQLANLGELSLDYVPNWSTHQSAKPFLKQYAILDAIINSKHKNIVLAIGRQFGKTWIGAMAALYYALNFDDFVIIWVVPNHAHIKKVLKDFEKYLDGGPAHIMNKSSGNQVIEFSSNRSRIEFRQTHASITTRGNTADIVIVDEAAFIPSDAYHKVVAPLTLVKGRKRIFLSSPFGKNWFYDLYLQAENTETSTISFTAKTEDNPMIALSEIKMAELTAPSEAFRQEYLAEFLDDGGSVFGGVHDFIIDVMRPEITPKLYAGIDYGKSNDYTVLTVLNSRGEMVDMHRFQLQDWTLINNKLHELLKQYEWPATYVETNGVGAVADYLLKNAEIKRRIWGWNTSAKSKEKMIQDLQMDLSNGQVKITNNDILIQEMNMFNFDIIAGHMRYRARPGHHDDCVMSLALANQARRLLHRV